MNHSSGLCFSVNGMAEIKVEKRRMIAMMRKKGDMVSCIFDIFLIGKETTIFWGWISRSQVSHQREQREFVNREATYLYMCRPLQVDSPYDMGTILGAFL